MLWQSFSCHEFPVRCAVAHNSADIAIRFRAFGSIGFGFYFAGAVAFYRIHGASGDGGNNADMLRRTVAAPVKEYEVSFLRRVIFRAFMVSALVPVPANHGIAVAAARCNRSV